MTFRRMSSKFAFFLFTLFTKIFNFLIHYHICCWADYYTVLYIVVVSCSYGSFEDRRWMERNTSVLCIFVTVCQSTGCIKMIGAVLKLIIFTSMVNRIINTSRNERLTQQVYDTYLQMFDVCTLRHTAHIEAIVQFLPYSAQQVRCDGLHSRGNSVLQIRYAHGLWWHKHFVLHVTPKEVVTRG